MVPVKDSSMREALQNRCKVIQRNYSTGIANIISKDKKNSLGFTKFPI